MYLTIYGNILNRKYCKLQLIYREIIMLDYNELLDAEIPMLLPVNMEEYYEAAKQEDLPIKLRATSVRLCLEGMLDLYFKKKIIDDTSITAKKWDNSKLHMKIEHVSKQYDSSIKEKFDLVRHTGNKGAHINGEVDVAKLTESIEIINELLIDVIVIYFNKYPLGTQNPVLTMLSAFPPIYRVKVLEKIRKNDAQNIVLIDKLSMAYLKSDNRVQAFSYLRQALEKDDLSELNYASLVDKLQLLDYHMDKFDRAKGVEDTKRIFTTIINPKDVDDYREFTMIVSALIYGEENLNSMCEDE